MGSPDREYESSDRPKSVSRPVIPDETELGQVIVYEDLGALSYGMKYLGGDMLPAIDALAARNRDNFEDSMCMVSYDGKEFVGSFQEIDAKVPWTEVEMLYIQDEWNTTAFQANIINSGPEASLSASMQRRDDELREFWTRLLEDHLRESPDGLSFAFEKAFDGAEESFRQEYDKVF